MCDDNRRWHSLDETKNFVIFGHHYTQPLLLHTGKNARYLSGTQLCRTPVFCPTGCYIFLLCEIMCDDNRRWHSLDETKNFVIFGHHYTQPLLLHTGKNARYLSGTQLCRTPVFCPTGCYIFLLCEILCNDNRRWHSLDETKNFVIFEHHCTQPLLFHTDKNARYSFRCLLVPSGHLGPLGQEENCTEWHSTL